jgi:hypothetical protein
VLTAAATHATLILYQAMVLERTQWKALRLLQTAGRGSTVPALMRRGCTVKELHELVRGGFARAEPVLVQRKRPSPSDFYLRITDKGQQALTRENRVKWAVRLALLFLLGLFAGVYAAPLLASLR